jgi:hypothetical protein
VGELLDGRLVGQPPPGWLDGWPLPVPLEATKEWLAAYEGGEFESTGPNGWLVSYRFDEPGPVPLDPLRQLGRGISDGYPCATSLLPSGHLPGLLGLGDDLDLLLDRWTARAEDQGLATLSVQHVPVESPLVDVLLDRGFVPFGSCAQAESATPWNSFDGYLETLTKNGRRRAIKERRTFEKAGYRVEQVPLTATDLDKMAQLHAQWLKSRSGHEISTNFIRRVLGQSVTLHGDMGEASVITGPDGIAGFCLTYRHDGALYPKMSGFDERVAQHRGFFNGVFYATLSLGADPTVNRIIWGPSVERAKVSRGANLYLRLTFVRRRTGVARELRDACTRRTRQLAVSLERQLEGLSGADEVMSTVRRTEALVQRSCHE